MKESVISAASVPVPDNYKWTVMIVVMVGMVMTMINASIINVAIPSIMANFGVNVDQVQWVSTGYMIAMAILMPLTAWFRDHLGYRRTFMLSLILFIVGSFLCAISWSLPILIFSRVIQALGAGAISPTGMSMITEVFPPEERGKATGLMGMGIILGPALGPTLGGYLTDLFGWRSIFLINLPIGLISLFLTFQKLIHDEPHESVKRGFDFWGYAFLTIFLITLFLGFTNGQKDGWTSSYILTCLIMAFVSFICFILVETQVKDKIIDIDLFVNPIFTTSIVLTAVRSLALFGGMFLLPLFVQQQMGFDTMTSGLILLPGSLLMGVMMPIVGRLSDKFAPRPLVFIGFILILISMALYIRIDTRMTIWDLVFPTILRGIGMAFLMSPLMVAMYNSIPQRKVGMASSINTIVQQVGSAMGIALLSTVLVNRSHYHLSIVTTSLNRLNPVYSDTLHQIISRVHDQGLSYAQSISVAGGVLIRHISQTALIAAYQDTFFVATIISAVALIPVFTLPGQRVKHATQEESDGIILSEAELE